MRERDEGEGKCEEAIGRKKSDGWLSRADGTRSAEGKCAFWGSRGKVGGRR